MFYSLSLVTVSQNRSLNGKLILLVAEGKRLTLWVYNNWDNPFSKVKHFSVFDYWEFIIVSKWYYYQLFHCGIFSLGIFFKPPIIHVVDKIVFKCSLESHFPVMNYPRTSRDSRTHHRCWKNDAFTEHMGAARKFSSSPFFDIINLTFIQVHLRVKWGK